MKLIIHVDNSDFFRKIMRTFLIQEGFEVESYDSLNEAAIAIAGGTACMVITGLTFAGESDDSFVSEIAQSYAGPLIIVSSSINKKKEGELRSNGVKAAFNKSDNWQEAIRPYLQAVK